MHPTTVFSGVQNCEDIIVLKRTRQFSGQTSAHIRMFGRKLRSPSSVRLNVPFDARQRCKIRQILTFLKNEVSIISQIFKHICLP